MAGVSPTLRRPTSGGLLAAVALVLAGACSQPAPPPPPAAPAVKTAEARTQWYQACWDHFNNKAWDQFQACYDQNAVSENVDSSQPTVTGSANIITRGKTEVESFPDRRGEVRLMLANGDRLASIALYTATNSGPMPGPDGKPIPATGKTFGMLMAHTVDLDPTGSMAVRDAAYFDEGTMMAQLGLSKMPARPVEKPTGAPPTVVIAKNDATEQANLAATRALFDAINKHDLKAIDTMTPADYRGIEMAKPADVNKKESMASTKEMLSAYPDLKITPVTMWAAGDYVVVAGTFEGTNTGDMPSMKMKKTGKKVSLRFYEIMKLENGKAKDDWMFYNGPAMAAQLGMK